MYKGAIIIVSHDRHLLELSADRLVLLSDGTAVEFSGGLSEYQEMIASGPKSTMESIVSPPISSKSQNKKEKRRSSAQNRKQRSSLLDKVKRAEATVNQLMTERSCIDEALVDNLGLQNDAGKRKASNLMKSRASIEIKIKEAELAWLEATEGLDKLS
jgi:ATP-binding cassette subfamily F protein 3